MAEENYKETPQCPVYRSCAIYQSGILRTEVEKELCRKGQVTKNDYIPHIHITYSPETKESTSPAKGAVCPSFIFQIESNVLSKIRSALEQNDFFWEKKITIDEIVKK